MRRLFAAFFLLSLSIGGQTSVAASKPTGKFNPDLYGQGCCSHHGGQAGCNWQHKVECQDGWQSSCGC